MEKLMNGMLKQIASILEVEEKEKLSITFLKKNLKKLKIRLFINYMILQVF